MPCKDQDKGSSMKIFSFPKTKIRKTPLKHWGWAQTASPKPAEAQLALLLGGGAKNYIIMVYGGGVQGGDIPHFRKIFSK